MANLEQALSRSQLRVVGVAREFHGSNSHVWTRYAVGLSCYDVPLGRCRVFPRRRYLGQFRFGIPDVSQDLYERANDSRDRRGHLGHCGLLTAGFSQLPVDRAAQLLRVFPRRPCTPLLLPHKRGRPLPLSRQLHPHVRSSRQRRCPVPSLPPCSSRANNPSRSAIDLVGCKAESSAVSHDAPVRCSYVGLGARGASARIPDLVGGGCQNPATQTQTGFLRYMRL